MRNFVPIDITKTATRWRSLVVIAFAGLLLVTFGAGVATAAPTPSPSGPAVVMTRTGAAGTYLVDSTGKSLYLFAADTAGKSTCNGPCAVAWPPLKTDGKPTAGPGVTASMLTTITRDDGSTQVAYNGHPLYYFEGDTTAGSTGGQGVNAFGGLWWLVNPTGAPIQSTPSGSPSAPGPTPSPGGGGNSGGGGIYQ